jgi:hypothetical protein
MWSRREGTIQRNGLTLAASEQEGPSMIHECAHCGHMLGFTAATCAACGWNNADSCFRWIKVWDPQDPILTAEHARRTRDSLRERPRPEPREDSARISALQPT